MQRADHKQAQEPRLQSCVHPSKQGLGQIDREL